MLFRSRPARSPEDAELADDGARADRGHLVLAVTVVPKHGGFAGGHEEERVRFLTLPGEDGT